jgi:hypothetical protein
VPPAESNKIAQLQRQIVSFITASSSIQQLQLAAQTVRNIITFSFILIQ